MIHLRWFASAASLGGVIMGIVRFPVEAWGRLAVAAVVALLIPASNLVHIGVLRRGTAARFAFLAQFGVDLVLLTVLLASLGGVQSPLVALYLLHILLAAMWLKSRDLAVVFCLVFACVGTMAVTQVEGAWADGERTLGLLLG
jgi:hypothetical protein